MPSLIDANIRHAVFVNRFAGGLHQDFIPFLNELRDDIQARLGRINGTIRNQRQLESLLASLKELEENAYSAYSRELRGNLRGLVGHEIDFEANSIGKVSGQKLKLPSTSQIWSAILDKSLTFDADETTTTLRKFLDGMGKSELKKIESAVRFGFVEGLTSKQIGDRITKNILGSRSKMLNRLVARTATNHIATTAQLLFDEENKDIIKGYQILAVLDNRTTNFCRGIDGTIVLRGDKKKPRPPFHIGCRTITKPVLDDRFANINDEVSEPTYYQWLKTEGNKAGGRKRVMDALGQKRGKLFLDGGLSADDFKKLTTDELFQPLPLDDLIKKDVLTDAFIKANIPLGE